MSYRRNKKVPAGTFWGFYPEKEEMKDPICQGGLAECKGDLTEFGKFMTLAEEGREPLMLTMSYLLSENSFSALNTICWGNNWQTIAFILASLFHGNEYAKMQIDLRVLKAKGYDRLRALVTGCTNDLSGQDLRLPQHYDRLVNRLFTSQGLPTP
jgi:hypothetical protein